MCYTKTTELDSNYNHLEKMSTSELLTYINNEDKTVALSVEKAIPQIELLSKIIVKKLKNGGRLFYIGAGTSGRLGILDASECPPTFGVSHELVNGVIGIVDEVGNGKIAEPFGTSKETSDTSLVESQYSWNSLTDFSNNIVGVKNVFLGTFSGENDSPGLKTFINAGDKELAVKIETQIEAAIAAINAIAGDNNVPFRQAIKDDVARVRVQAAIDALGSLQASLEEEVVPLIKKWNL